ncbi:MAG: hypothetical protein K2M27_06520 [Muribaculaceae bacterium]|nr:hypothetical protein [Muribaculaceae bacterium]
MNKIKRAVFVVLAVMTVTFCAFAESARPTSPQPNPDSEGKNGRLYPEYKGKRPRVPSRIYLEYLYDGNGILIIAPEMYPEIETSVTGKNVFYGVLNDSNGFYLETGSLEGAYVIVCTTNDGSVFSGELIVD